MGDEVDIYSDLPNEEEANVASTALPDATMELDLLDTSVIPRQPTPMKLENEAPSLSAAAAPVTRVLQLDSERDDPEVQDIRPEQMPRGAALQKEMAALRMQNALLKHNISILYATAKHIQATKDKEIASLRTKLDNLIFRRNNRGTTHCSTGWNGYATGANLVPVQYVAKDYTEGKDTTTTVGTEERAREMSSDLQRLYDLSGIAPLCRKELKDVRHLSHHEADLRNSETKQGNMRTDSDSTKLIPVKSHSLAGGRSSLSSTTRNPSPIHKERGTPVSVSRHHVSSKESATLCVAERKRRRSRSPTEPRPRKIGRSGDEPRERHTRPSIEFKRKDTSHKVKACSVLNRHVFQKGMPDDLSQARCSPSRNESRMRGASPHPESRSTKRAVKGSCLSHDGIKSDKDSSPRSEPRLRKIVKEDKCRDVPSVFSNLAREFKGNDTRHEIKASSLHNGHVSQKLKSGSSSSGDSSPLRNSARNRLASSQAESVPVTHASKSHRSLCDSIKSRTESSSKRPTASSGRRAAKDSTKSISSPKRHPASPLRRHRTSLGARLTAKYLHRRTLSSQLRHIGSAKSMDRSRSRHVSIPRERVSQIPEQVRQDKRDVTCIKSRVKDSRKGSEWPVEGNCAPEDKESPNVSTKRVIVETDKIRVPSDSKTEELEEGEVLSD